MKFYSSLISVTSLSFFNRIWEHFFLFCLSLFVLIPISPLNAHFLRRDSGVFLYTGWRILNGELPYRDIWDHKPPLIFYINAIGQILISESRWGTWLLEVLSLFVATYIGFQLLKSALGKQTAIFSTFIWLFSLFFIIEEGNLTEEFALPLQFACLLVLYRSDLHKVSFWRCITLGILIALSFFLKQTAIGIGCAVVLYLILQRIRSRQFLQLKKEVFSIFSSFFVISASFFLFFGIQGALDDFWMATFHFNFVYAKSFNGWTLLSVLFGLRYFLFTGFLLLSMFGCVLVIKELIKRNNLDKNWKAIIIIGLIDFPIELLLISTSGRIFAHYYLTLLPCLTIFSAFAFSEISKRISMKTEGKIHNSIITMFAISIIALGSFPAFVAQVEAVKNMDDTYVAQYIENSSMEGDTVLLWGAESAYNFESQRKSPSKYVYLYPLYTERFVERRMIEGFLSDIRQNQPVIIIDTKNELTPFLTFPLNSEEIEMGVSFIKMHYQQKEKLGDWIVYEYIPYSN